MPPTPLFFYLDFETLSRLDLKKVGVQKYAADPSTDFLCACWFYHDHRGIPHRGSWAPRNGLFPAHVRGVIEDPGTVVVAHNAPFEIAMSRSAAAIEHGIPPLDPRRCLCTMALALTFNLPASLEDACIGAKLPVQKDTAGRGRALMLTHCKPNKKTGKFKTPTDEELGEIIDYCHADNTAARGLHESLPPIIPEELRFWQLGWEINERGVPIDVPAVKTGARIVTETLAGLDAQMREVTGGKVRTCNSAKALAEFCGLDNVAADTVSTALADYEPLPDEKEALELRQKASAGSVKKLQAILNRLTADGRIRGLYQFHGAGTTGREAGRGVQLQNLARPEFLSVPQIAWLLDYLGAHRNMTPDDLRLLAGPPFPALRDCLRGFIQAPPGKTFVQVDFSAIEGMTLAWEAEESWVLDVYRGDGKVYEATAATIYLCSPEDIGKDDPRRQVGKVAELALGYQGGVGAFQAMAEGYGVSVSDKEADRIKVMWREARPKTVNLWYRADDAAKYAVRYPGEPARLGCVEFQVGRTPGNAPALFCTLPSGRRIAYPFPGIEPVMTPWGKMTPQITYRSAVPNRRRLFERKNLYGGRIVENITQAVARDILRDAMLRMANQGFQTVHHCHDEVLIEVNETTVHEDRAKIQELIEVVPDWCPGLPLRAAGWIGERYRK